MGRVVANHEQIDGAASCNLRGQAALVAGQPEQADAAVALRDLAEFEAAARTADLLPLVRRLDIVKRLDINIRRAQLVQDSRELGLRLLRRSRLKLYADENFFSA